MISILSPLTTACSHFLALNKERFSWITKSNQTQNSKKTTQNMIKIFLKITSSISVLIQAPKRARVFYTDTKYFSNSFSGGSLSFTSAVTFFNVRKINGFNICPTFVQHWKLNGCWVNVGWTECSNGFNAIQHFQEERLNVESMLNESLNQFKFDSTHFQQAFNIFFLHFDLFKRPNVRSLARLKGL